MGWKTSFFASSILVSGAYSAATWPSSYDELEDIMLLNQGYKARQLSIPITPCNFPAAPGHVPAAGFLRTAFHDVAPHNAAAGTGGLDASVAFELTGEAGADNAGPAFNNTLTFLQRFYSTQASMSDLIALGAYTAVRGCGGPVIPIRTGRKDAVQAGALGVPKVTDTQSGFKGVFSRMGFSSQDMIKMVACGHTLGGVHSPQFPQIVPPGSKPLDVANFDNTSTLFDNQQVMDFVQNKSTNPLVVGPSDTNADLKIYTTDGGLTIRQMAEARAFQSTCKDILQRMIDTVPKEVSLTEAIQVYDVKPSGLSLTLTEDGKGFVFVGEVRIRTTSLNQSSIGSVSLVYKDRKGNKGSPISTTVIGTASGWDDSFTFYNFSTKLDTSTSISSFDVAITGTDGSSTTYNNNGRSFPVQDLVAVQVPRCSLSAPDSTGRQNVEVVAAVKGGVSDVELSVSTQTARSVPFPLLATKTVTFTAGDKIGDYVLYKGSFSISPAQINSTTFDVSGSFGGKTVTDGFKHLFGFGPPSDDSGSGEGDGDDGSDNGGDGNGSGDGSGDGSNGGGSSGSGKPWEDWQPVPPPAGPPRPCGESEGCDAQVWATETVWHVSTVPVDQHTTVPGTPIPTSKPIVPGQGYWSSSSKVAPSASPPNPVSPEVATFTGAAGKNVGSASALLIAVAAAFVVLL